MEWVYIVVAVVVLILLSLAVKIVWQYQRGIVFRLGKFVGTKDPGFNLIWPIIDRLVKVDVRIVPLPVEPQEVITKDNVTMKVDAVVYFWVVNPEYAVIKVLDYVRATHQIAQTTLRSVLGQSELDEILAHRDEINRRLREIIDEQTEPWGVQVTVTEIKDIQLPEGMQRAMARQAEAERERRAKVVHALGEYQAAQTLTDAAGIIAKHPAALQLRYLQTLTEMAGEKNCTIIPVPLDIMGAVYQMTRQKETDGVV
ncbi:MAG: slipin family protein [Dehalococcoidia bacterium]|nr:slipin family protein [Dehalococcoidia bacterium]